MKLKKKDFEIRLAKKSEKSLLRGIQFFLKHGDQGIQFEAQRLAEKQAAKADAGKPNA
jgi:hypothetical protein